MDRFEKVLMGVNRWALIALLAATSVIVFANVVLRYSTNASIEWAEEVARYLMVWLTFLGAGPVLRYGGHIAVENLQDALPRPLGIALRVLVALLLGVFFVFMIGMGWQYCERAQYQMTPTTQISMAWVYAAIPIGGVLLSLHWVLIVRGYLSDRRFASDAHFDANASASL